MAALLISDIKRQPLVQLTIAYDNGNIYISAHKTHVSVEIPQSAFRPFTKTL